MKLMMRMINWSRIFKAGNYQDAVNVAYDNAGDNAGDDIEKVKKIYHNILTAKLLRYSISIMAKLLRYLILIMCIYVQDLSVDWLVYG